MLTLDYIQGVWDCRNRKDEVRYIFDQDYLSFNISDKLDNFKEPDFMQEHSIEDKFCGYFFGNFYLDGDLLSFIHHSGPDFSKCSGRQDAHNNHNFCGFAGRVMEYTINGELIKVKGAWSSGSYHWNEVFPLVEPYIVSTIKEPGQLGGWGGVNTKLTRVLELMRGTPYVLVQGLGVAASSYEIVHKDDVDEFIASAGIHPNFQREGRFARWSHQKTPEDVERAIMNAKVFVP